MDTNYCLLIDITSLKEFLNKELHFSKSKIKKYIPRKALERSFKKGDELYLPLDMVNSDYVNPNYVGDDIQIIHECDDFVVVNKPEGVHGHPLEYSEDQTVLNFLRQKCLLPNLSSHEDKEKGLLYRLDEVTSGVLVYVKNTHIHSQLRKSFDELVKTKRYLAIVEGDFSHEGLYECYLAGSNKKGSKVIISDSGSLCSASFSKVSYVQEDNVSLVEIKLKSGYRHQIRAQLSSLGFPIVGDELYGAQACSRVFLHALEYAFEFEGKSYSWCATSNGLFCDFLNLDSLIKMP